MIFFVLAATSVEVYDMKFGLLFSTKVQIFESDLGYIYQVVLLNKAIPDCFFLFLFHKE